MAESNSNTQLNSNGDRRGMSPKSRENLAKGHKPNKRASVEFSVTAALKNIANEPCPERFLEQEDYGQGLTWRQAVAKRIWIEAAKGNTRVYSELLDRLEGKVTQPVGGEGGGPIKTETKIIVASEGDKKNVERVLNGERT